MRGMKKNLRLQLPEFFCGESIRLNDENRKSTRWAETLISGLLLWGSFLFAFA
jgi:hypothetical protein